MPAWAHHPMQESAGLEGFLVAMLALSAALYVSGLVRLWRRAGRGRGISLPQAGSFVIGWGVLSLALGLPLDRVAGAFFPAHLGQHELLLAIAPPLLGLGRPPE